MNTMNQQSPPLEPKSRQAMSRMNAGAIALRFSLDFPDFSMRVDTEIPAAGVTALLGESGSGKSSLLQVLAGTLRPSEARIKFGQSIWQDDGRGIFVPPHLREIGFVYQEVLLFPHLNVRQNIEFGLARTQTPPPIEKREHWIELLGIGHLLKRGTRNLSGGEAQRVGIARALFRNPKLLLMDEPLSSLDERRKNELLPMLETLHREMEIPIIYVSHSILEVRRLAQRVLYLREGAISSECNSILGDGCQK